MIKFALFALIFLLPCAIKADTGHEGALRLEAGRFGATAVVTGSSTTGTSFVDPRVTRPAGVYLNNTSFEIWIGTTSATQNNTTHSNIGIGFPLLSSATFNLGSFTGNWYFTCAPGQTSCEVRALEGRMKGD